MDIDKNDIQLLATQIPMILIESSFTLLKTYPKASFALCSLFFSYIFVPSILWFLIYTIPFIVLITAITIQTYISINRGRHARKHDRDKNGNTTEDATNANKKYNAKHGQSVRRRRAKVIFAESREENIEEKETISSTNFTSDLVDKRALVEETPKEIREVEVNNDLVQSTPPEDSQDFRSRFNSFMRSQTFGGSSTNIQGISLDDTEDEDDEGAAVQWSEDDQKNLADLGLSEIERNRRLESLIERRRAQKVLSFQLRRTMMNMQDNASNSQMVHSIDKPNKIYPLSPRSSHFNPVSAPTVLFPVHNPFDLPYEPHEEKPNLTEDSFHQEFLGTHPQDMTLCRHECPSSGADMRHNLHNNHGTTQEVSERQQKYECQLGKKDEENKVEQDQSQEVECNDKVEITDKNISDQNSEQGPNLDDEDIQNEVKTKSVIVEDYNGSLSYSSSSEEDEPISRLDKEKILKSLSSPNPRNINIRRGGGRIDDILLDYGSSETEKSKRIEYFNYPYDAMRHTPSHSIASDLQVEVSEFGSPPHLSDGNISSSDDVRSFSDSNFEKEIPDSEIMWIPSSQQSRANENESRLREICQVSEEDDIGVGFSRIKESMIPAERVNEQDSSDPHQNFQDQDSTNGRIAHEVGNEYKLSYSHESDEVIGCSRSPEKFRTEVETPFQDKDEIEKKISVEAKGNHIEETRKNVDDESLFPHNTVNNSIHGEPLISATGSRLNLPFDGEAQYFQNNIQENLITNEEADVNISCMQGGRDLPDQSHAASEEYLKATIVNESTGESSKPTFTREVEQSSEEMLERMDIPDTLSTEGNYISESTTDTEDEGSSIARSTSEPRQHVIQPNEVVPIPELQTEHAPTASSTSSSPKSVLNPRFSGDQSNISFISDVIQMENQNSGGESSRSNSSSTPALNAAPLAEDLTTYQPHERSTERVQGQSNAQLVSTEEVASSSGSLSRNDIDMGSTDHGQKETFETSFVYTDIRNQETNLDTTSSNEEETDTNHRKGRL